MSGTIQPGWRLADLCALPASPQNVNARKIADRQTASRYLEGLVEIGVLTERAFGREKLFIHQRLMGLVIRDTNDWVPFP